MTNNSDTPHDLIIPSMMCSNFLKEHAQQFFGFTDTSMKMIKTNHFTANQFGFEHYQDMQGHLAAIAKPMPVKSILPKMLHQNQTILATQQALFVLHIGTYNNDNTYLVISLKQPVINKQNQPCGVLCLGKILPSNLYQDKLASFSLIDNRYTTQGSKKQIQLCYTIIPQFYDHNLTVRESECLYFTIRGKSAKLIADFLGLSKRTVEEHKEHLRWKLNASSQAQVLEYAIMHDLTHYIPESLVNRLLQHDFSKKLSELKIFIKQHIHICHD